MSMITSGYFSSLAEDWETPQDLFDKLDDEFLFTLDVCAKPENSKCKRFFSKEQNGLNQDWGNDTVWCNPPYGKGIENWIKRCYEHSMGGGTAVMLLPARTDTRWFHNYILGKAEIRFCKGRLRFNGCKSSAPFPSIIVIYRRHDDDE